jgi:ubiquitin carboxyl-terminal hydrolase 36/42
VIDNVTTIKNALEYYTMAEKIEDYRCESCSKRGFMEKQFLLNKTPSVTALHLKRFKNIEGVQKIDSHVSFSMELDFQPYSSGNGNDNVSFFLQVLACRYFNCFSIMVLNSGSISIILLLQTFKLR